MKAAKQVENYDILEIRVFNVEKRGKQGNDTLL